LKTGKKNFVAKFQFENFCMFSPCQREEKEEKFNPVIILCCFEFSREWGWLGSDGEKPNLCWEIDGDWISNLEWKIDLPEALEHSTVSDCWNQR
jgi:hypothetical protein